jgi:hypothetical protein
VGTRYKSDDFTPYIYKTEDYGKTWKLITNGIAPMHFTRAICADRKRQGLLYAGTEYGMYISYDDGEHWRPFQLNLPTVPVTDIITRDNDLIVATQGRAFWMIDDLTPVQQYDPAITKSGLFVYDISPAWRIRAARYRRNRESPVNAGENPPGGVLINFYSKAVNDSTKAFISIYDKDRKLIKKYSSDSKKDGLDLHAGMNQFAWDMLYPGSEKMEGMILWNGTPGSILAPPGEYFAGIRVGVDSAMKSFSIKADPNYVCSQQDYEAQFAFLQKVQHKFNDVQETIAGIRSLRKQLNDFVDRQGKDCPKEVKQMADSINRKMTGIEETLYQTKSKSGQDVLNYPIRLNDKLAGVFNTAASGNMAPSKQVQEVYAVLSAQCDEQISLFDKLQQNELAAFNQLVREKSLPVIRLKEKE